MNGSGKNKRFEDVFKMLFPEAYKKRQEQLKNKTKGKKHSEERGMGPEEFFKKQKTGFQNIDENEWGEPYEIMRFKRGSLTIVRKMWSTDTGVLMKEYIENDDGSLSEDNMSFRSGHSTTNGANDQMMGFIIDPSELMKEISQMNEDMEDPEMTEDDMFGKVFGVGGEQNHFSFDDNVSTPYNTEHLEQMLEQALNEEDYETAAQLRDMMKRDSNFNI